MVDTIWGVIRAVLAALGGLLVGKGYLDESTLTSLIGALGVLFTAGWSIWDKISKKKLS